MPAIQINRVPAIEFPLIHRFYASNGFKIKCGRREYVYRADIKNIGESLIVGAVRYKPENGYVLLRNLCVASSWRRQGVARILMTESLKELPLPIYCFSFSHLVLFYESIGFVITKVEQAPADIVQGYSVHKQKFPGLALMSLSNG